MKTTIRPLLVALFATSFFFVFASDIEELVDEADYMLYMEDFHKAYELYMDLHKQYPGEESFMYHYEIAYQLSEGRGSDLTKLLNYESTAGENDKFYNYWLGRIYFYRYEFEESKARFNSFLEVKKFKSPAIINEARFYLRKIDRLIEKYAQNAKYDIIELGDEINSKYADISPAFYKNENELLFASARPLSQEDNGNTYRIFHSVRSENGWTPVDDVKSLGTFTSKTAKVEVVSENGKLFIYREKSGDLNFSEPVNKGWTVPREFDSKLKKSLVESHFFISDEEDHIFFASDKGGNGLDIYESYLNKKTGEWSNPAPVLGSVNSDYDEDSPFLSHDGKYLYFSSNRPTSLGGFDVYRAKLDQSSRKWSKPENLGYPINTIDDEINFQVNEDGKSGYLSSKRLGSKGDYDIYYFQEKK